MRNITPFLVSCNTTSKYSIDNELKSNFISWHNSLSEKEKTSIELYANIRGWFWNEFLHIQKEPQDIVYNGINIVGSDYQYISSALDKAIWPYDYEVYHGVEYQENEFYDQLKDFIHINNESNYDYSECVGKTIQSYGFISTSLDLREAEEYCDWMIFRDGWESNNDYNLPLKTKVVFKIRIPKGFIGAAYLADFIFGTTKNNDNQVLINRNCQFLIKNIYRQKDINYFEVDLVQNNY